MDQAERQFRLYSDWPENLMSVELQTYQKLDTDAWMRSVLSLLDSGETGPLKMVTSDDGGTQSAHFLDDPQDSRRQTIRLLRYLSSEQMFAMLLSAERGFPYTRFVQTIKFDQINSYYATIAQGEVPEGLGIIGGHNLDFENWIAVKAGAWDLTPCCSSLSDFIRNEALFLSDRTFVNALKHGRCQSGRADQTVGVDVELGREWMKLAETKPMIWVDEWVERKVDGRSVYQHYYHAESFDMRQEIGVLQVSAFLMRAVKTSRATYLRMRLGWEDTCSFIAQIPNQIVNLGRVDRFKNLPAERNRGVP